MVNCYFNKHPYVEKILDEMDEERNQLESREPTNFDVMVSQVRTSCVQWGNAPKVAGTIYDFLQELNDQDAPSAYRRVRA